MGGEVGKNWKGLREWLYKKKNLLSIKGKKTQNTPVYIFQLMREGKKRFKKRKKKSPLAIFSHGEGRKASLKAPKPTSRGKTCRRLYTR